MKKRMNYLKVALFLAMAVLGSSNCFSQSSKQSSREVKEAHYSVLASDVAEINIFVKDRAIEIVPSSDGEIHITYFQNSKEFYQIALDENKVLSMQSASDKNLLDFFGLSDTSMRSIKLEVPNPLPCNVVISTTKNDIKMPDIVIEGNVAIHLNQGSITLENTFVLGDLTLNAKNGGIAGILIGSYEDFNIQSKAHKGKSNLPERKVGGTKALNVNTNNGDIEIEFTGSK